MAEMIQAHNSVHCGFLTCVCRKEHQSESGIAKRDYTARKRDRFRCRYTLRQRESCIERHLCYDSQHLVHGSKDEVLLNRNAQHPGEVVSQRDISAVSCKVILTDSHGC